MNSVFGYLTTIQGFMSAPILLVMSFLSFSILAESGLRLTLLFLQVSMQGCGFETTFFGKCYPGKMDPLLVPEKRQDLLFQLKTKSTQLHQQYTEDWYRDPYIPP